MGRVERRLDVERVVVGRAPGQPVHPARTIDGGTDRVTAVEDVHQHLQVGLHLPAPAGGRAGDDATRTVDGDVAVERVHRPLAGLESVRRSGVHAEVGQAIVEDDAGPWYEHARAELVEQRVDERHGVAELVGDGDGGGVVAAASGSRDEWTVAAEPGVREQLGRIERHPARISEERQRLVEHHVLDPHEEVGEPGRVAVQPVGHGLLDQAKRNQQKDAHRHGWLHEHGGVAVPSGERGGPLPGVGSEVGSCERTADRLHVCADGLGDRPAVERVAAPVGDHPQRLGEIRLDEATADRDGAAEGHDRLASRFGGDRGERVDEPTIRHHRVGVVDGRREQPVQRHRAELRRQLCPCVNHARHTDGQPAMARNLVSRTQTFDDRERRDAAAVEAADIAVGRPDDGEAVTTEPTPRHLGNALHRRTGDGRVDGIAAGPKDVERGRSGERMTGRHGAVASDGDLGMARRLHHRAGEGRRRRLEISRHGRLLRSRPACPAL